MPKAPPDTTAVAEGFLSPSRVCELTSLSQPTLWRRVQAGTFPKPVPLGGNRKGYRAAAVTAWLADPEGWRPTRDDGTA